MRFQCLSCKATITVSPDGGKSYCKCPECHRKCLIPQTLFDNGCVIADFVIREKIGSGYIGTVYKAEQLSSGRNIALKILSHEFINHKTANDFLRNACTASELKHVNIVNTIEVGMATDNVCYIAMDYITGKTLQHRLNHERYLPVDESLHIIQQVGEALHYAWGKAKLIHRDVKPENIMINSKGVVKLTDFGLAIKAVDSNSSEDLAGSPAYMSPEQFSCESLDFRSDIYSLGVTLYQMLCGNLPFGGATFQEIARQHFGEIAVPLSVSGVDFPLPVSNLVKRMMEKRPEERFNTTAALLKEIWAVRQITTPDGKMIPRHF